MKFFRIFLLISALALLLCGCRNYSVADLEVSKSPVAYALDKSELANPPQDPKEQEYSRLNQPLHLIPRELFTSENGIWTEYIQPEGIGVYYLYSYDAGESINTYVVYLDIIAHTTLPYHGFTTELGEEYTFYTAQQRIQISPGFIGAVKWDKTTDTLSVWENPPYNPTVQISQIEISKGTDEIGTVLTDWLYSGTVSDPISKNTDKIPETNILPSIISHLIPYLSYDALNSLSYGIIYNPEENGSITESMSVGHSDLINGHEEWWNGHASFPNNYILQNRKNRCIGIGSVSIIPNGKLSQLSDHMFIECNFSGTSMTFAEHLDWKIDINLSLER